MTQPIEIRKITSTTPESIAQLIDLRMEVIGAVFNGYGNVDLGDLKERNLDYYKSHITDGTHVAFIAYAGHEVAGCGGACLQEELPSPDNPSGLCAYIMNIYVKPAFRHMGTATAIIAAIISESQSRGCGKIWLESTYEALNLYTTNGFYPLSNILKYENSFERKI